MNGGAKWLPSPGSVQAWAARVWRPGHAGSGACLVCPIRALSPRLGGDTAVAEPCRCPSHQLGPSARAWCLALARFGSSGTNLCDLYTIENVPLFLQMPWQRCSGPLCPHVGDAWPSSEAQGFTRLSLRPTHGPPLLSCLSTSRPGHESFGLCSPAFQPVCQDTRAFASAVLPHSAWTRSPTD